MLMGSGEKNLPEEENMGGSGGDARDALVLDMDGEDLIFSEDAFTALPDYFPSLSSPTPSSPSPSSASNAIKTTTYSSSSSSSSSASWAFVSGGAELQRHAGVPDAMLLPPPHPPPALDPDHPLDILGDIDLLDSSSLWDPSMLFSDDNLMIDEPPAQPREPAEASTEDLALVFLEWLKTNRDSISPEDLRSIKLKKSTIECAARRLGGGTQGMMQLLKLILAWVQNNHLEKKKRHQRDQTPFLQLHHHLSECTTNPNPNPNPNPNHSFDYNPGYNVYDVSEHGVSWVPNSPYQMDPTSFSSYGHAVAAPPPAFHYQSTTTNQPFSPAPEFVDPAAAWPSHFATTQAPHYSPLVGCFSNQFQCSQFYQQDERLARMANSATKEARKKRMARQRRISALHHHHHHHHHHNRHRHQHSQPTAPPTSPLQSDAKDWASSSSSPASLNPPDSQTQQQNNQHNATSSADKRQGLKTEKNLRFLLQKVLKQSDVGSLGRIVLPKKEAEIHLPELDARDGISIAMEDIGTSKVWNMRYRYWPNNKSRMYLLENTGDFVRTNGLQEGDFIVIYTDVKCGKYMIRGVKVRQPPQELKGSGNKSAGKTTWNQRRSGIMEKGSGSRSKCSICCEAEEASTSTGAAEDVESPTMSQMDFSP